MAETMFSSVNANSSKAITAINLTFDINYLAEICTLKSYF